MVACPETVPPLQWFDIPAALGGTSLECLDREGEGKVEGGEEEEDEVCPGIAHLHHLSIL